jgi:hypothetical protein
VVPVRNGYVTLKSVTMSNGNPIAIGPTTRLPSGLESVSNMSSEATRELALVPGHFLVCRIPITKLEEWFFRRLESRLSCRDLLVPVPRPAQCRVAIRAGSAFEPT